MRRSARRANSDKEALLDLAFFWCPSLGKDRKQSREQQHWNNKGPDSTRRNSRVEHDDHAKESDEFTQNAQGATLNL